MKKFLTILAAVVVSLSASAQQQKALADSKLSDNWYIGVHGGVNTQTTNNASWLNDLNPTAGLRIGRWITPSWGMFLDADVDFDHKTAADHNCGGNIVKVLDVQLGFQTNLMNLFCGYKGEPRTFEILPFYSVGWGHMFLTGKEGCSSFENHNGSCGYGTKYADEPQCLTSKAGLDLAFNFGSKKQFQFYVEPAMRWTIANSGMDVPATSEWQHSFPVEYNINKSKFQVTGGFIYKFQNSNGTHNFALVDLRDQAEIDGLNGKINDLRGELSGKDAEIARLKKALADCENKPAPKPVVVEKIVGDPLNTNLMPKVIFKVAKSNVEASQVANVEMIAKYMQNNPESNILIKGYASVEGNPEKNVTLSVDRANAVKEMLIKKYKVDANRLSAEGLGATSELSPVLDFNRVVTFSDTTKK